MPSQLLSWPSQVSVPGAAPGWVMRQVVALPPGAQTFTPRPWQSPMPLSVQAAGAVTSQEPPTAVGRRPTSGKVSSMHPSQSLSWSSQRVSLPMSWLGPTVSTPGP